MTRRAAPALVLALFCAAMLAGVPALPACALAAATPTVARAAAPLSVSEFSDRLARAHTLVSAQRSGLETTTAASALADGVDSLLPPVLGVREGTRTIAVDLGGVSDATGELRVAETTAARRAAAVRLLARIDALSAAVAGTAGTTTATVDPSDPAAVHEMVAALPRSSSTADDWLNTQIQKFLEWVAQLLDRMAPGSAGGNAAAARVTMILVIAIPVLLALIVLMRALRTRRRRATAGVASAPEAAPGAPAVAAAADLPADALGYAARLAAAGAHRDAVRALYGGAARHLVEGGAVSRLRTRTNREMLRDVAVSAPAAAPAFEALTGEFERAWYGHADPGSVGFEHARAEYVRVVGSVPETGDAADGSPAPAPADHAAPASTDHPGPAPDAGDAS